MHLEQPHWKRATCIKRITMRAKESKQRLNVSILLCSSSVDIIFALLVLVNTLAYLYFEYLVYFVIHWIKTNITKCSQQYYCSCMYVASIFVCMNNHYANHEASLKTSERASHSRIARNAYLSLFYDVLYGNTFCTDDMHFFCWHTSPSRISWIWQTFYDNNSTNIIYRRIKSRQSYSPGD